ncbi:MAG: nuclear transport factor 2 family protein [Bacteroidota bacterium]
MDNKEIFRQIIDAFEKNDFERVLTFMAEDIEWNFIGDHVISGLENIAKMQTENPDIGNMSTKTFNLISEGNIASANGDVSYTDKEGKLREMHYCDWYELENGKIKKMTSYVIDKKKKS